MTTSYIAFLSKSGIVAASDSDFSIRPLSKTFPAMIVVNIYSRIPWKTIIDQYLLENEGTHFTTLQEAYDSFTDFFRDQKIEIKGLKKDFQEDILFMGYNEDNIYPILIETKVEPKEENYLEFTEALVREITHRREAFYVTLGEMNIVSPILVGATHEFLNHIKKTETKLLSSYRERVLEKIRRAHLENNWVDCIESFDVENAVDKKIQLSIKIDSHSLLSGISSFSIQEMVDYAETLINAEVRLRNLKNKNKGNASGTREIAVMTIPEGFTWIKHHLFAI